MVHRVDAPGATGANLFTNGSVGGGIPATEVEEAWLNDMQEEVCNAVEAANIVLSKGAQNQLIAALATGLLTAKMKGGVGAGIEFEIPIASDAIAKLVQTVAGKGMSLHAVSAAGQDPKLRLIEGGGSAHGWAITLEASTGVLRFAYAPDAGPDGSGAYANQFQLTSSGEIQMIGQFNRGTQGYSALPNGMITQWGQFTSAVAAGDSGVITFSAAGIEFPTACVNVTMTPHDNTTAGKIWLAHDPSLRTKTSFKWNALSDSAVDIDGFDWIALGY